MSLFSSITNCLFTQYSSHTYSFYFLTMTRNASCAYYVPWRSKPKLNTRA